jgi:hypothetical protein
MQVQTALEGIKKNYQLLFGLYPTEHFRFKTRIQGSTYRFRNIQTIGYCIAQDILCEFSKLRIRSRFAYFLTEDYYNRQYMYENDLLYAYSYPAYNGHGIRTYVVFRYNPARGIDIWLKAAHYHYFNTEEIGTGLLLISGNKKTEIKCQVRIKF